MDRARYVLLLLILINWFPPANGFAAPCDCYTDSQLVTHSMRREGVGDDGLPLCWIEKCVIGPDVCTPTFTTGGSTMATPSYDPATKRWSLGPRANVVAYLSGRGSGRGTKKIVFVPCDYFWEPYTLPPPDPALADCNCVPGTLSFVPGRINIPILNLENMCMHLECVHATPDTKPPANPACNPASKYYQDRDETVYYTGKWEPRIRPCR